MFTRVCVLSLVVLSLVLPGSVSWVRAADDVEVAVPAEGPVEAEEAIPNTDKATHPASRFVKVTGSRGIGLQTLTILPDGHLVCLVARSRHEPVATDDGDAEAGKNKKKKKTPQPEIRVFDAEGTEVRKWTLPFNGHSVGAAPDGTILVAGEAKIARYSADGNLLKESELTYVADLLKNKAKLTELAEGRRDSMVEMYERYANEEYTEQIDEFKKKAEELDKQIEELQPKEKDAAKEKKEPEARKAPTANPLLQLIKAITTGATEEDGLQFADVEEIDPKATPLEKLQRHRKIIASNLKYLEQQSKEFAKLAEEMKNRPVPEYIDEIVEAASRVFSVAANEKEIFVATGELTGYGYSLWRMGPEFDNPERVIKKLSGCCGQIDVQVKGDVLFVADNTQHAVTKYDREGKKLGSFGKTGRVSNGLEFGSCCNPMNCRIDKQGYVYTAESEGVVKKFSEDGVFLELVGVAKLEGGCKNVAVAVSPDAKRVYFCDQPGSRIVILEQKEAEEKQ